MKKAIAILIIFLLSVFQAAPAFCADTPLDIDAQAYILMDAKTGSVLYEYQPDLRWRPASTTKIMTALIALRKGDLKQVMTAKKESVSDIGVGGMNIGIQPGEQMTLNDLMHAFLIVSASEAANTVADNLFPTRAEFIQEMNKVALEIGCKNTTFTNACGIDEYEKDANHFSSARDLALIAKECLTFQTFKDIVSTKKLDMLPPTNKHKKWNVLNSTNKLLGQSFSYGPETGDDRNQFTVTGIKTGSTMKAGSNFISSAINKDGLELISVVLGVKNQPNRTVFDFTKTLLKAGFENFSNQMIIDRNTLIQNVTVKDSRDDGKLDIVTNGKLEALLPNNKDEWHIEQKVDIKNNLTAPIKKGTVLGNIEYTRNGISIGKVPIVASRTVDQNLQAKAKTQVSKVSDTLIFKVALILAIIIACFLILRFVLKRISRKRKYRQRRY